VASFRVVAAAPGHGRLDLPVEAKPGEEREETYYLESEPGDYTVVVRGERVRREITRQVIPAEEVAQVAGTQGDTLKAVLNLPGVARTPFIGGQLILRGSSPGDSAVFVEGLEIPLIYHFGGLRSTFAPRFLESLEFVPGNFAPDYGRLTGGIVNVKVRDPKTDLVRGEVDLNLFDGGAAVEGPLSREWSAGAAARRSWVGDILPHVLPKDTPLSFSTAPAFWDYQLLATWKPGEKEKLRLLLFGSQDELVALFKRPAGDPTITGNLTDKISFHELLGTWSQVLSPGLKQESSLALGLQTFNVALGPTLFFDLKSRRVDGRTAWSWQALPWLEARAGLDLQYASYDISLNVPRAPGEGTPNTPISTMERVATTQTGDLFNPAAFVEARLTPTEGLDLLPSLRVDRASAIGRWALDPRFAARWKVLPDPVL
jgi:outer membrane receptor protein involved in Fe transport